MCTFKRWNGVWSSKRYMTMKKSLPNKKLTFIASSVIYTAKAFKNFTVLLQGRKLMIMVFYQKITLFRLRLICWVIQFSKILFLIYMWQYNLSKNSDPHLKDTSQYSKDLKTSLHYNVLYHIFIRTWGKWFSFSCCYF